MAEVKKYYWLKLQKDFFKRTDVRIIENMPNGKDYILFYLKLLVESISHEGSLRFSETIPYSDAMLAAITNTNVDIIRSAVKVFSELGLMSVMDDGTFYMNEINKMIGCESEWAEKKRNYRQQQKLLTDITEATEGQKRTMSDKSLEIRDKSIDIYNNILSCNDEIVDNSVDNSEDIMKKELKADNLAVISKIIEYLNEKCNVKYKASSAKTKTCIIARLNDGFKLEDFMKVIDIKAAEWLNNPEMSKYLRPETLFGSKFESYLNQKTAQNTKQNQAKKPANKFHNFNQHDDYGDLEEMARKRFEKKIKSLGIETEKHPHQEGNKL